MTETADGGSPQGRVVFRARVILEVQNRGEQIPNQPPDFLHHSQATTHQSVADIFVDVAGRWNSFL